MKDARFKPKLDRQPAFGGVQVVVTGEFCQLPPVKPFQHCIECGSELFEGASDSGSIYTCRRHGSYPDEDKWAFRSQAWEDCDFAYVHLRTIHRQSDQNFIRMLQKCRIGEPFKPAEIDFLMDHPCEVANVTQLFATREDANRVNERKFNKLGGRSRSYWCWDTFVWRETIHPHLRMKQTRACAGPRSQGPLVALREHRYAEKVELKPGMLVVLLTNLDMGAGLCNGSQGIVAGFAKFNPADMPRAAKNNSSRAGVVSERLAIRGEHAELKEEEIKRFISGEGPTERCWPVVRFHNGQRRIIFADCSVSEVGDEWPYSLLARTQIPLAPAWAMTIHKSQSLTLDRVIVNLSKAFEEGQVYVALSRATCLEGLKIEGSAAGLQVGLGGNKEVQAFLREKFGDLQDQASGEDDASPPPLSLASSYASSQPTSTTLD